jgi:hypothetical protein
MNTRKIIAVICAAVLGTVIAVSPSWAGSKQRHRWEGVAIGIGAAILGKAILDTYHHNYHATGPHAGPAIVEHHYHQAPPEPAGYWETRKEWIPPVYTKKWNPGHHNRHGHWVEGHWLRIEVQPGYWEYQKVWVPY